MSLSLSLCLSVSLSVCVSLSLSLSVCLCVSLTLTLSVSLCFSSGVVSVSFEEDDEGNLCLIAYPLHSDQETKELAVDSQPKNKILQWVNDNQAMEVCSHNSQKDKDER